MIVHNLLIKLHDSTPDALERARELLLGMTGKVPGLRHLAVHPDLRRAEASYDLALIAKFDDMATYQAYLSDPEHLAVGRQLAPQIAGAAAVCYQE